MGRKAGSRGRIKWKSNLSQDGGVTWGKRLITRTQVFGETECLVTGMSHREQRTIEREGLK